MILISSFGSAITFPHFSHVTTSNGSYIGIKTLTLGYDYGSLLAVARAEARKREHVKDNPPIRSLIFVPELGVYVALYEALDRTVQKLSANRKKEH